MPSCRYDRICRTIVFDIFGHTLHIHSSKGLRLIQLYNTSFTWWVDITY